MNKRFKYITLPKILHYITGYFILDKLFDIYYHVARKKPIWPDADADHCGKYFCRYCGGKKYRKKYMTSNKDGIL